PYNFSFLHVNPILSTISIKYGGIAEIMNERVFCLYIHQNLEKRKHMKTMRSALVVGATGLVGSSLVKLLCESEEYAAVNVISRRPLDFKHPKLVVKLCEFDQIADKDIEFAHEVFCCLGTTMKKAGSKQQFEKVDFEYPLTIAAIAKNRGVGHFIVISAMGANEKALAYYSKVKGKLEAELIKMDFPRLSIVRPSLITGNRQEFRLGE